MRASLCVSTYEEADDRLILHPMWGGGTVTSQGHPGGLSFMRAARGTHEAVCLSADPRDPTIGMQPWVVDSWSQAPRSRLGWLHVLKHACAHPISPGQHPYHTANGDVIAEGEARAFVEHLHTWLWRRSMPVCPAVATKTGVGRGSLSPTRLAGQPVPARLVPVGRSRGQRTATLISR